MMRNVSPRAHAHIQPGLPGRDTAAGRNMTGIFLGTDESKAYPKARHIIPPLARCRALNKRARTPTEDRRYKLVELLRYKEERRGFSGNPIKRRTPSGSSTPVETPIHTLPPQYDGRDDVEIWDITRQTQRHFTAATNSGVTHLEFLNQDIDGANNYDRDAFTAPLSASVLQEVHRVASGRTSNASPGLTEAYKNVCKSNIESLQHLLPARTLRTPTTAPNSGNGQSYRYTGFTVKSYRNPNQAEIAANFEAANDTHSTHSSQRVRAVGRTPPPPNPLSSSRPYVPSPFFYKTYSTSPQRHGGRAAGAGSPVPSINDSQLGAIHGSSMVSRSFSRGRQGANGSTVKLLAVVTTQTAAPVAPRGTPVAPPRSGKSAAAGSVTGSDLGTAEDQHIQYSVPHTNQKPAESGMSGTEIVIGLEDEQGAPAPVEIDETDDALNSAPPEEARGEEGEQKRRVSITDRVLRNKNCELQMKEFEESATQRKAQLAELLNEHAQIVQEVVTMVKSSSERSLAGKENNCESDDEQTTGDVTSSQTPDE